MQLFSKTHRFFSVPFAAAALVAGIVASPAPSHASYYCNAWAPHGNVCHWQPVNDRKPDAIMNDGAPSYARLHSIAERFAPGFDHLGNARANFVHGQRDDLL
jgi:hypothetical protein